MFNILQCHEYGNDTNDLPQVKAARKKPILKIPQKNLKTVNVQ